MNKIRFIIIYPHIVRQIGAEILNFLWKFVMTVKKGADASKSRIMDKYFWTYFKTAICINLSTKFQFNRMQILTDRGLRHFFSTLTKMYGYQDPKYAGLFSGQDSHSIEALKMVSRYVFRTHRNIQSAMGFLQKQLTAFSR